MFPEFVSREDYTKVFESLGLDVTCLSEVVCKYEGMYLTVKEPSGGETTLGGDSLEREIQHIFIPAID